jgi:hypothetical protein
MGSELVCHVQVFGVPWRADPAERAKTEREDVPENTVVVRWERECKGRQCEDRGFLDCDAAYLSVWLFDYTVSNSRLRSVKWLHGSKYWRGRTWERLVVAKFKVVSQNLSRVTEENHENLSLFAESETWLLPKARQKCLPLRQLAW